MTVKKPARKCTDNKNLTDGEQLVNDLIVFDSVVPELPLESLPTVAITVRDKIITLLDVSAFPNVAIDAEWQGSMGLTKQITICDNNLEPLLSVVIYDNKYPLPQIFPTLSHPLVVYHVPIDTYLFDVLKLSRQTLLFLYFAFKDLVMLFGAETARKALENGVIDKKRNISGTLDFGHTKVKLRDCFGMFNSSLENGLSSVGIDISKSKTLAHGRDKSKMSEWLVDSPETFLPYAMGDTVHLVEAVKRKVAITNKLLNEVFPGSDIGNYDYKTFKFSAGALVNDVFLKWLCWKYPALARVALKISNSNNDKTWASLKRVSREVEGSTESSKLMKGFHDLRRYNAVSGLGFGGIKGIALENHHTGIYGTVVQGGRCLNEAPPTSPKEAVISNVIDPDLSSCYGNSLRGMSFPIGIPTVYGRKKDDKKITLKTFLNKYEKDLVPGLYTIYVSGTLDKASQDLIYSKYDLSVAKLLKKAFTGLVDPNEDVLGVWDLELETTHMGGQFLLTKKQVELGIITHDALDALRKVASSQELPEFMNLTVEAAIYYPQSLRLENDNWVTEIENNPGQLTLKADTRSRKWTSINLEEFIGKFIDTRKKFKKQIVTKGDSFDLIQDGIKLFVNTLYGDFAAPYFEIGNTVLANNITTKARLGVWMMSKALLSSQSITDGGMFSGDNVYNKHPNRKSGLTTLANRKKLLTYRYTEVIQLISQEEKDKLIFAGKGYILDEIVTTHVNNFWTDYGLTLPFDIECKYSNCGHKGVSFGSADYGILSVHAPDGIVIKVRGAREQEHPKQMWIRYLLGVETEIPKARFDYSRMVGVGEWKSNPEKFKTLGLLPGDDFSGTTYHKPFKNGQSFDTYKAYKEFVRELDILEREWLKTGDNYFGWAAKEMDLTVPELLYTLSK